MIYEVWQHFFILALSLIAGFIMSFCFDAVNALRIYLHIRKRNWLDLCLWLFLALLFFVFWQLVLEGAFRPLYFIWLGIGFIIYFLGLDKPLSAYAKRKTGEVSPYVKVVNLAQKGDNIILQRVYAFLKMVLKFIRKIKSFLQNKIKIQKKKSSSKTAVENEEYEEQIDDKGNKTSRQNKFFKIKDKIGSIFRKK